LRKSKRIKKIKEDLKEHEKKPKPKPKHKSEGQKSHGSKPSNRAPMGSLTNNPEWNGVIKELERSSHSGLISYEQYQEW